ncbi:hypothetical protein [Actinokineospora fastidiosa]|uniref:Uncharacterized protein n=1 Tax=Actinokineospora fastidiosa TaxID=1816 RepID=A0A918GQW6_9PSEU|nr:hypothetical protein [Actinokineospora fastidiosa]GGS53798.1 hypothetical protein GCM10010171_56130 [Actinokineospora fastidiosa]
MCPSITPSPRRASVASTVIPPPGPARTREARSTHTDRRTMLAPAAAHHRQNRAGSRRIHTGRGRALRALAVSLVVLAGCALAATASAPDAVSLAVAVQPVPAPFPTVDPDPCDPTLPQQSCAPNPTTVPTAPSTPCTGEGCIPQPDATTPPPTNPGTGPPGQGGEPEDECGITDIGACITEAINAFFRGIVTEALNPLLDLLSRTLLTTPMPGELPRVGELWDNSWQILLLSYGLLVLIAGVIAMGYQSVQTRHSIKELAPRLVVGFLAGALSLWVATKGIQIANGLVAAIMGGGVDAGAAGETLRNLVLGSLNGGIWIIFIGIFLAGMLIALLVTYVVRVALTIILIAGAPLALMFHALPQTEGIAYWWWKAYGGCLAIQVGQSMTLIVGMNVFLAPGGFTLFGPTMTGLVNLLVALALMYILFKIPFWVLSSIRTGNGRSLVGSLVKGFLAYKTFGLLGTRGGGKGGTPHTLGGGRGGRAGASTNRGSPTPYANPRAAAGGQYVLPLPGVRRTRAAGTPSPKASPAPKPSVAQGRQLALPLGEDWPENRPILGRDGGQLPLPFDPYRGNRPTRSGQYPLPLDGIRRVSRPPSPPPPPPVRPAGHRVVQPQLPFDPYQGNRATRSGQYPLPFDDVRRVPAPRPAPPPAAPPRPAPRPGRQLRLPLDLPKPPKPSTPAVSPPPPPPAPPATRRPPEPGGSTP